MATKLNLEKGQDVPRGAFDCLNGAYIKKKTTASDNIQFIADMFARTAGILYALQQKVDQEDDMNVCVHIHLQKAHNAVTLTCINACQSVGGMHLPQMYNAHFLIPGSPGAESLPSLYTQLDHAVNSLNAASQKVCDALIPTAESMVMSKHLRGGFAAHTNTQLKTSSLICASLRTQLWRLLCSSKLQVSTLMSHSQLPFSAVLVATEHFLELGPCAMHQVWNHCKGNFEALIQGIYCFGGPIEVPTTRNVKRTEIKTKPQGVEQAEQAILSKTTHALFLQAMQESEIDRTSQVLSLRAKKQASKTADAQDFIQFHTSLRVTSSAPLHMARAVSVKVLPEKGSVAEHMPSITPTSCIQAAAPFPTLSKPLKKQRISQLEEDDTREHVRVPAVLPNLATLSDSESDEIPSSPALRQAASFLQSILPRTLPPVQTSGNHIEFENAS